MRLEESCNKNSDLYRLCLPVLHAHPITEHVPLNSKTVCKNISRVVGGANNIQLSWGGTNIKHPKTQLFQLKYKKI